MGAFAPFYLHFVLSISTTGENMNGLIKIEAWFDGSEPEWLRSEFSMHALIGDEYNSVVAAGIYHRLYTPLILCGKVTRRDLASLLSCVDTARDRVRAWASKLTSDQIDNVLSLSLAEVESMHINLSELQDSLDIDDPNWVTDLHDIIISRDNLECVYCILTDLDVGRLLGASLSVYSRRLKPFIKSLPSHFQITDQRLSAVKKSDHEAWWGIVCLP
jgi:hypothetical protein